MYVGELTRNKEKVKLKCDPVKVQNVNDINCLSSFFIMITNYLYRLPEDFQYLSNLNYTYGNYTVAIVFNSFFL